MDHRDVNLVGRVLSVAICISYQYFALKKEKLDTVCVIKASQQKQTMDESWPRSIEPNDYQGDESDAIFEAIHVEQRKTNLPNVSTPLKIWYSISSVCNAWLAVKYTIICLLLLNPYNEYGYLDCYMLGRVTINSRIVNTCRYGALTAFYIHCFYRFCFLICGKPEFKIHCLEFLLMKPNRIQSDQTQESLKNAAFTNQKDIHDLGRSAYQGLLTDLPFESESRSASPQRISRSAIGSEARRKTSREVSHVAESQTTFRYSTLLHYRNHFDLNEEHGRPLKECFTIRPNRTLESWRHLAKLMIIYLCVISFVFLFVVLPGVSMIIPMFVTRTGFELNYESCVRWIAAQSESARQEYRGIFQIPKNFTQRNSANQTKILLTYDDLVEMNAYHSVRLIFEVLENTLFYVEIYIAFTINLLPAILASADICSYCRSIEAKINQFIKMYHRSIPIPELSHSGNAITGPAVEKATGHSHGTSLVPPEELASREIRLPFVSHLQLVRQHHQQQQPQGPVTAQMSDYERQLVHIQALIIDMFAIIRDYNPYATFFTVIAGIVWYIFSFICCRWLFISGSNESHETHKLECYVIQFLTTSLILLILGSFARVKIVCGHLRQFITTMISFDRSSSFRKRRWHIILNFYTPVPLYCFNVSRTSELSWLLGCKWTGWLFSVLLIVSNFFDYLKKP